MSKIDWDKDPQAMMKTLLFKQKGQAIVEDKTEAELPLTKNTVKELIQVVQTLTGHNLVADVAKEMMEKQSPFLIKTYTQFANNHRAILEDDTFIAPDGKPHEATSDYKLVEFIDGPLKGKKRFFHKDKLIKRKNYIVPIMNNKKCYSENHPLGPTFDQVTYYLKVKLEDCEAKWYFTYVPH
jgi:hypothetical protein